VAKLKRRGKRTMRNPNRFLLLLILLLVVVSCLTWGTLRVRQNAARRAAYRQIWQMGGGIGFQDEEFYDLPARPRHWTVGDNGNGSGN
jgi:hypothetical protein